MAEKPQKPHAIMYTIHRGPTIPPYKRLALHALAYVNYACVSVVSTQCTDPAS